MARSADSYLIQINSLENQSNNLNAVVKNLHAQIHE
jgi:hypothetical protein